MARPMTPAQEAHMRQMASLGGQASAVAKKAKGENAFGRGGQGAPVARRTPTAKPATGQPKSPGPRRAVPAGVAPSPFSTTASGSPIHRPTVAARHTPAGHMAAAKTHAAPKAPRAHTAQPVARPPAHAPKAASSTTHKSFAGSARGKGK